MANDDNLENVTRCAHLPDGALQALLDRYGLQVCPVPDGQLIPGSFWGEAEAGLIENRLYVRPDTPVHSALHEACHYICMDGQRRRQLDTDAGGDYDEENGVCYLQILLAGQLAGYDSAGMMRDMDRWGYTFRLGSASHWFQTDADDVHNWLQQNGLITSGNQPTWQLRD